MKDETPVYRISLKDDLRNRISLCYLIRNISAPKGVLELFGGRGGFTRAIRQRWPEVPIISYDTDKRCADSLRTIQGVTVKQRDSVSEAVPEENWGIVADFNLLTLSRAKTHFAPFFNRMLSGNLPSWMIVTDSAPSKLHINYRSYGLSQPDILLYIYAWEQWLTNAGYGQYFVKAFHRPHFRSILLHIKRGDDL